MDAKPVFTVPEWFPRNPCVSPADAATEVRRQWNLYLSIPKGSPARSLFTKDLSKRYGESLQDQLCFDLNQHALCESSPPSPPPVYKSHKRLFMEEPLPNITWPDSQPVPTSQSATHYTATQVELSKLIAAQLEMVARSRGATILDMRKAYDCWLQGHTRCDKADYDKLQKYGKY